MGDKKFKVGDRVAYREDSLSGCVGKVIKVFDNFNLVIVDFNGEIKKVPDTFLTLAPAEKPEGKAQAVQLALDDFHDYAIKFTSFKFIEELFDGENITEEQLPLFAAMAAIIFDNLETMIFGEP